MLGILLYLICLPIELASAAVRCAMLLFLVYSPLLSLLGPVFLSSPVGIIVMDAVLVTIAVLTVGPLVWSIATLIGFPGGGTMTRWQLGAREPTSDDEEERFQEWLRNVQSQHPGVKGPRRWYVLDVPSTNAYVIGTTLYVETGLIASGFLEAVLAHELGHLNSLDGRLMLAFRRFTVPFMYKLSDRLGVAFDQYRDQTQMLMPIFSRNPHMYTSYGCASLSVLALTRLLQRLLLFSGGGLSLYIIRPILPHFLRRREFAADRYAAQLDYGILLAQYLRNYAQANDVAIPYYRNTHPYVNERVSRLRLFTPAPPKHKSVWLKATTYVSAASVLVLAGITWVAVSFARNPYLPTPINVNLPSNQPDPQPTRSIILGDPPAITHMRVTGVAPQPLRVREKPARDAAIVARVPEASIVERLEQSGDGAERWCRIRFGTIEGWVSAQYLQEVP